MPNVRYVSRPGGFVAHLTDGRSEGFVYNQEVDLDQIADYQRANAERATSETRDAAFGEPQIARAHRDAALADAAAVQVPSNYTDLDEESAVVLMSNVDSVTKQAALLMTELQTKGGRSRVFAAASPAALALHQMAVGDMQAGQARVDAAINSVATPPVPGPVEDPAELARLVEQANSAPVIESGQAPPPADPASAASESDAVQRELADNNSDAASVDQTAPPAPEPEKTEEDANAEQHPAGQTPEPKPGGVKPPSSAQRRKTPPAS